MFRNCLLVLLCLALGACQAFGGQGVRMKLETENQKCGTKKVDFRTDYQVEVLTITRHIEGGGTGGGGAAEGCGGGYTISLGKGTTKDADPGMWKFLGESQDRLLNAAGIFVPGLGGQSAVVSDQ